MEEEKLTFIEVLKDAQEKYNSKLSEYGESWKQMTVEQLVDRIDQEFEEFAEVESEEQLYGEIIDLINVLCMLATKVRQKVFK